MCVHLCVQTAGDGLIQFALKNTSSPGSQPSPSLGVKGSQVQIRSARRGQQDPTPAETQERGPIPTTTGMGPLSAFRAPVDDVPVIDGPWWFGAVRHAFTVRAGRTTDDGTIPLHRTTR
jgi:hypothetical protein